MSDFGFKAVCVGVAILVVIGIFVGIAGNFNDTNYTVTITDKERINTSDESRYLVFAEIASTGETIVFENTDTFWRFKWNSSDIQGNLKIGETYTVTVVGWRVPFFSWYQNIIAIR